jgi:hypothetical protein
MAGDSEVAVTAELSQFDGSGGLPLPLVVPASLLLLLLPCVAGCATSVDTSVHAS